MNRLTDYVYGNNTVDNPRSTFRDESLRIGSSTYQRSLLAARWENVLVAEGFGMLNIRDNRIDVSNEVDNIFEFTKISAFKNGSPNDILLRKILLAEYVKPYYSNKSLNRSLLVSDSFVNDIIDTIAVVYSGNPKRFVPDSPELNAFIAGVVESGNVNSKLLEAHKWLKLGNNVAIKIVRRMVDDESVIDIDVYDPTQYRVLYNNDNELVKICYVGEIYHPNGAREEVIYVYTKTNHYYCNLNGERFAVAGNPEMTNPYGIIPFVVAQLKPTDLFGGYDADLIQKNLNHNMYKLSCNDDSAISTRHLTFLTNIDLPDNAVISNQDIFVSESKGDEKPTADIISGEPHFKDLKELYDAERKSAALERGVPSYMIENNFRELNSAKALVVQTKRLIDTIRADVPMLKQIEKRLWKIIGVVAGVESRAKRYTLPANIDLSLLSSIQIDYPDILSGYTDMDRMQEWILLKQQVGSGVLSVSDMVRYYNTDITTKQEALETLRNNLAENDEFREQGITSLFDLLNDTNDNNRDDLNGKTN